MTEYVLTPVSELWSAKKSCSVITEILVPRCLSRPLRATQRFTSNSSSIYLDATNAHQINTKQEHYITLQMVKRFLIYNRTKLSVTFRNIAAVTWCMCVNGGSVVADAVNRYSTHFNTPAYDIPVN